MATLAYDIKQTLAVSSRSLVRRAVRKSDGLPVIIKSPAQEQASSDELWHFELEHRLLERLRDVPSVVHTLALERTADSCNLILQDFGGQNPTIPERGLALETFFLIAVQAARGLGQIHDANVVHKDVKPSNLLVNVETGELKFIDFHLASELTSERQELTAASQIQGSFPYMSPEQTGRMNRELDYRSDYYSLGVTLFELATGQLPFQADDAMGFVHAHLSKRPPLATQLRHDVPSMVSAIIAKLLAKDPDERYQSSLGIVSDLERCQQQWLSRGSVATFSIGAHDVSERFAIPQKLFGRDSEIAQLLEAFREVCAGQSRLLLISGPSGIGKTSLIHELERPATHPHASFASGKFDQLDRSMPYGAFIEALRGVVKQLLFDSATRLDETRSALLGALGQNVQVIVDLIPELSRIVGHQPASPLLGPAETQQRFRHAFREFVRVLATAEHPLVLFVDDLQWMDASTPDLLTQLFTEGGVNHLLVVGTYRDNEVKDGHLLTLCLRAVRERRPDLLREIKLEPLTEAALNELVAETLRAPKADTAPLTRLLQERTEGNPFFVSELLSSLHRAGAFSFQRAQGSFSCDLARVHQATVSESVAELMVQRLERLSPASLRALTAAACMGAQFELGVLAELTSVSHSEIAGVLWEALTQRVIVPLDANYRLLNAEGAASHLERLAVRFRFQHDRVHRAAYELLEPQQRASLHVALGRRLDQGDASRVDVFEVVNHLRLGASLLQPHERRRLLDLHVQAGDKAERSAAYAIAAEQFELALGLAREQALTAERLFEVQRQHVKCTFLAGNIALAAELCEELFSLAPSTLAKGSVYVLKTQIVEHQGKLLEAVATIRAGLGLFGVELPEAHVDIDRGIGDGIGKMQAHLARVPVEELARLPELEDPERVMTLNLLFQVIPPAIQTHPPLFVLAELMMFDLALRHGVTAISCKNFVDCGIIQGGILGNYDVAYRLGQTAFALLERYRPTPLESSVHFVFGAFVSHFKKPFREGFESFERAARSGLQLGDIQHLAYATVHRSHRSLLVGTNLADAEHEAREAVAFLEGAHAVGQLLGMLVTTWSIARLRGSETVQPAAGRSEAQVLSSLRDGGNAQWLYSFGQAQTCVSFLLGDMLDASRWQSFAERFEPAGVSLFSQPDYHLFRALLLLQHDALANGGDSAERAQTVGSARERLEGWAKACPENFDHKLRLLEAEIARSEGKPMADVLAGYEAAIDAAGHDFIQFSALSHELQGRYLIAAGQTRLGRLSLQRAYRLYEVWGATAKLERLTREFPESLAALGAAPRLHRAESATTKGKLNLDLVSVLKATRAISSEMRTEHLFRALMDAIIENAGAELGCLVLKGEQADSYRVEAWAAVDQDLLKRLAPVPLDEATHVCHDIVRHVAKTRRSLVLDDAAQSSTYQNDPDVQQRGVRSLLCIPVLHQGELLAVLYAENNATRYAFTSERVETLSVISSQAAISISNALLYQNLEHKVELRTRELADKNREMGAMLDGMEQGVFTVDKQLKIQPQYSRQLERILGTSRLRDQAFMPLLFRGAKLRPDELATIESALRFCFEVPPFMAEVNLSHVPRSFEAPTPGGEVRFLEVDWNPIVDDQDRVSKILVVVRDVTTLRQLKDLAQRREREADIVGQILDSGLERFREFLVSAERLLEDNRQLLQTTGPLPSERLRALFRNVHTIKGNARLFGYSHIVDVVHQVEELYSELRAGRGDGGAGLEQLRADIERIVHSLQEYAHTCERKLTPLAQTRDARLDLAASEIEGLLGGSAAASQPEQVLTQIRSAIERLRAVPLAELVKDTSRMFPSLARELSKSVPWVECADSGTLLNKHAAGVMRQVLVQAFRNALAHGIEDPAERTAHGKAVQGTVCLRAEPTERELIVRLSDDGQGLAIDALRQQTGLAEAADEELAEALFSSGVSTTQVVSRISGRGVGMDLIRASLRKLGGDVKIAFTAESARGYRPFELVVSLPRSAVHV